MSYRKIKYILAITTICLIMWLGSIGEAKENIVAVWLFDEGKGDTVKDTSGNGNNGKKKGGVDWADGKFGKALKFNGKDGCLVEAPHNKTLDFTNAITIGAWVYWQASTARNYLRIIDKGPGEYTYWLDNDGTVCIRFNSKRAGNQAQIREQNGRVKVPVQEWHHIAFTYDTKVTKLYIDGKLAKESDYYTGAIRPNAVPVIIGNWQNGQRPFNGIIDELFIANAVLTESQIKELKKGLSASPVQMKGKLSATWCGIKEM